MAFRKVWGALAGKAGILWASRGRRRRLEGASRSDALKSREDRTKRDFFARGTGAPRPPRRLWRPCEGKWRPRETPKEMRRHAFSGAWPKRSPEALARRCGGGRWDLLKSRRCDEKPRGSQKPQPLPGHPGERVCLFVVSNFMNSYTVFEIHL